MLERVFAIGIDDHDWSQEVYSFNFARASTLRTVRDGGSVRRLPGRRTASMTLTMPRTEDAEALVGTIPEDGRAEVLLMLTPASAGQRPIVVARRFDATTLLPPWDTTVDIDGVTYFESAWFAVRVSSLQMPMLSIAA